LGKLSREKQEEEEFTGDNGKSAEGEPQPPSPTSPSHRRRGEVKRHVMIQEVVRERPSKRLVEILYAGCSKTLRYKAPETPRSESYSPVRRNDEG
jgi:hypothetical protein